MRKNWLPNRFLFTDLKLKLLLETQCKRFNMLYQSVPFSISTTKEAQT